MARRVGKQTIVFDKDIAILNSACCVGKTEGEGPIAATFDKIFDDDYLAQETYEAAESMLLKEAISAVLKKSGKSRSDVNIAILGDLLDKSMASSFAIKDFSIPHFSVFSACSASALTLGLGSNLVDSGASSLTLCAVSSHFCTAERQFRFPLNYGSNRTPNSQRTVT
ncbi:MAG: stage V sporulation protein AD, partial [Clostridia bacterium]|nr:stage V sporulation protein AD [Clostridia bacterium]